jgi:NADH dehydrogenase
VQNRISTVATWLATIARARRTDRTFMLGSPTTHEQPYTWAACGPATSHRAVSGAPE